jgi:hypothetical protein
MEHEIRRLENLSTLRKDIKKINLLDPSIDCKNLEEIVERAEADILDAYVDYFNKLFDWSN